MNVKDIRKSKGIPVVLNGQEFMLKFDLNAFALLEEQYGGIEPAMDALEGGSIKALRVILWAGLAHNHLDQNGEPLTTVREVGSWIDIKDLPDVAKVLGEALGEALPEGEEQKVPVPLASRGKGKNK